MTDETKIAEAVAERLEGRKLFTVSSRETVYYYRDVYANSKEEAEDICMQDGDWGEISDGHDFEVYDVQENTGVN